MELTEKARKALKNLTNADRITIVFASTPEEAEGQRLLYAMMTVGEASERWGLHVNTIKRQIMRGGLVGRKSKTDWLVTTQSMVKRYGIAKMEWQDYE